MLIVERGMKSVSVLVPPHEILLIPISVAAPSTVAPASPKALGGSMTSKGVPASRMRMRLRRAQTTDHGFNLPPAAVASSTSGQGPPSGSALPGHMVGHAGPNHSRAIEFEAAMKAQQLIDR